LNLSTGTDPLLRVKGLLAEGSIANLHRVGFNREAYIADADLRTHDAPHPVYRQEHQFAANSHQQLLGRF
jgi:hypothetical protein